MDDELIALTADIVSAMVANNKVDAKELPVLIQSVHSALALTANPAPIEEAKPEPAVSVKSSVKHDYIVCLEDGAKLKMLKRYLRTNYDMSPEDYRAKWDLPASYPMTAPAYAEQRRVLAKTIGLGRKKGETVKKAAASKADPKPRGRPKGIKEAKEAAAKHLGGS